MNNREGIEILNELMGLGNKFIIFRSILVILAYRCSELLSFLSGKIIICTHADILGWARKKFNFRNFRITVRELCRISFRNLIGWSTGCVRIKICVSVIYFIIKVELNLVFLFLGVLHGAVKLSICWKFIFIYIDMQQTADIYRHKY